MSDLVSYIYLLQDGKDIGTNVYKVGRTTQQPDSRTLQRLKQYSHGTIVHNVFNVPNENVKAIETHIKKLFVDKYKRVRGTEWFLGNVREMKKDIDTVIDGIHMQDTTQDDFKGPHGILFDNMLCAQWAYMFDNMNWQWEYKYRCDRRYNEDFVISFNSKEFLVYVCNVKNIWERNQYNSIIKDIYASGYKGYYLILGNNHKLEQFHNIDGYILDNCNTYKIGTAGSISGYNHISDDENKKYTLGLESVDNQINNVKEWLIDDFDYNVFQPHGSIAYIKLYNQQWFCEIGGGTDIDCAYHAYGDVNNINSYYRINDNHHLDYKEYIVDCYGLRRGKTHRNIKDFECFWNESTDKVKKR